MYYMPRLYAEILERYRDTREMHHIFAVLTWMRLYYNICLCVCV